MRCCRRNAALTALLLIAGVFTFGTSMHERYLFPAAGLALLAYIYSRDRRLLWLSVGFSATSFLNTYYVLYHATGGGTPFALRLPGKILPGSLQPGAACVACAT